MGKCVSQVLGGRIMKLETINNQRIITPTDGMWLLNLKDKVISDKVYLGKNADESVWEEISESEKHRLEAEWENETETTDADYAQAGKILLGVE